MAENKIESIDAEIERKRKGLTSGQRKLVALGVVTTVGLTAAVVNAFADTDTSPGDGFSSDSDSSFSGGDQIGGEGGESNPGEVNLNPSTLIRVRGLEPDQTIGNRYGSVCDYGGVASGHREQSQRVTRHLELSARAREAGLDQDVYVNADGLMIMATDVEIQTRFGNQRTRNWNFPTTEAEVIERIEAAEAQENELSRAEARRARNARERADTYAEQQAARAQEAAAAGCPEGLAAVVQAAVADALAEAGLGAGAGLGLGQGQEQQGAQGAGQQGGQQQQEQQQEQGGGQQGGQQQQQQTGGAAQGPTLAQLEAAAADRLARMPAEFGTEPLFTIRTGENQPNVRIFYNEGRIFSPEFSDARNGANGISVRNAAGEIDMTAFGANCDRTKRTAEYIATRLNALRPPQRGGDTPCPDFARLFPNMTPQQVFDAKAAYRTNAETANAALVVSNQRVETVTAENVTLGRRLESAQNAANTELDLRDQTRAQLDAMTAERNRYREANQANNGMSTGAVVGIAAGTFVTGGVLMFLANKYFNKKSLKALETRLTAQITTLQGDLATANGNVTTLQGDLATAQGDLAREVTNLATVRGELTTARAELATANTNLASATQTIADRDATIDEQEERIRELDEENNRLSLLEDALNIS
ncbi:MAG: hypothetical protein FWC00_02480 [Firmicutes bacterium]|nr:hypothetical protein [Bacillota bacterium]